MSKTRAQANLPIACQIARALGIVVFAFSIGFPPLDDLTTIYLTLHMLQHTVIVVAGILIGYYLFKRGSSPAFGDEGTLDGCSRDSRRSSSSGTFQSPGMPLSSIRSFTLSSTSHFFWSAC